MKEELERIEALDKSMLVPADVAKYLGCSAYTINIATRDGKNPFPFPVIRMGNRVRIPKEPFIKSMRGE
jgi:excisionase family DNA binding protein